MVLRLDMSPKLSLKERLILIKRVTQAGEDVARVCREANISRTVFYRWLSRYKKENRASALVPKGKVPASWVRFEKLSPKQRLLMIEKVKNGESVQEVCEQFGVSRTIFYKYLKRYEDAPPGQKLEALWDKKPKVERYFNQAPEEYERAVLSAVIAHPELSSHKIVWVLPQIGNRPILSNHGVYNILKRYDLTSYEKRLLYAAEKARAPLVGGLIQSFEAFLSNLLSQKPQVRTFLVRSGLIFSLALFTSVFVWGALSFSSYLLDSPSFAFTTGTFFALTALLIGMFFFIYSLKYYLTIAIVLSFSRKLEDNSDSGRNFFSRIFMRGGINQDGKVTGAGLYPDLSNIKLKREPFVSVHVALYNEKRVVERLLTALTSFSYENYEVVIADDSTDETLDLIKKWSNHPRIKISHRETREGFKGGALREALKHTDRKAEFIMVFDADFIPYPDTITQFLKYFQATCGTLDFSKVNEGKLGDIKVNKGENTPNQPSSTFLSLNEPSSIAAVQGYQWHVLNKSENWVTRGVRSEYSGSYVIERSGEEIYQGLKQISGSVYMIRRDVLESIGWGNSITEDFQLTLKLYEKGYKVVYTPYVQAPAEAVSTIKRLIRQRMRWAEGHSYNVKRMFGRLIFGRWEAVKSITGTTGNEGSIDAEARDTRDTLDTRGTHRVWVPSPLTPSEKLEFAYLTPYYLQAAFFIAGTISWFIAEVIFQVRLPFWTEVWGWSLILTNMLALPLMNMVGLFLEEAEEKDYLGLFSFVALSYVVAPFQAYAAVKGFLESQEGPWFRTPKTGRITDVFTPGRFYRFVWGVFGRGKPAVSPALGMGWQGRALPAVGLTSNPVFAFATANNSFQNFKIRRRHIRWVGNVSLIVLLLTTMLLTGLAPFVPASSYATQPEIKTVKSANSQKDEPTEPESIEEITTPVAVRFEAGNGEMLEMIFHRDPRVRIKLGEKELDITTQEIQGVGRANPVRSLFVDKKEVRYEEIVPGVDLVYRLHRKVFSEEFVIKRPLRFNGVKQKVTAKELEIIGPTPGTFEIYDKSGREVFRFGSAFLAEKEDLVKKSTDVSLTINKKIEGYELVKTIGEAGKIWLAAAERIYPVILDPPVTIVGSGYANGTADYGGIQRKLVFMETRDRYYAVANVSSSIQLWISDDNTGSAWTQLADIDDDNDDHDPTIVKDGDNFWIAWNDQSNDNPQFRRITTDASSETYEAVCTGPDMGAVGAIDVNAFGVASTYLYFYSDNDPDVYRITKSEYPGSCESTDFTSITNTTDGPIAGGEGAFQVTTGDELHAIWRTTSGMRHGIYSGSAWNTSAPFTVNSFNSDEFSVVKDSSNNLYVSAEAAAGEVHVYKCSATCTGTWSDLGTAMLDTDCASGYTDVTMNSLTYDSTNDDLILFAIATDATNERACFRASSDMGSNWESTTWDLGYVSADLNYLSSIHTVADPTKAAITIRNAATYSFATVPEKSLFLLFSLPFLSAILGELKKRKL